MGRVAFDGSEIFTPEGVEGQYQTISFLVTSVTVANPIRSSKKGITNILLFATQDCHIRSTVGGDAALVTDMFIPANILVPIAITSDNKISAIRDSADGILRISPVI